METIFAAATPVIKSGVAIIRISGEHTAQVFHALTKRSTLPPPRQAQLVELINPQDRHPIDKALTLWFPAPHSFTGENTLEFHTHGSLAVIEELLSCLSKQPHCRMAQPGEFAKRAFYNGKMDLTEAEGLADLIEAETKLQARQAYLQSQGNLKTLYTAWREQIIAIAALTEAYIDFPDEDIPQSVQDETKDKINTLLAQIHSHLDDGQRGEKLRKGLCVVIAGAPNAGKSSLINLLSKRDVAIVSDTAGTTRDSIEVHLDIHGYPVTLIDTAGLRESDNSIESLGIERTITLSKDAECVLALVDSNNLEESLDAIKHLESNDIIYAINKSDCLAEENKLNLPTNISPLYISARTGAGIPELLKALEEKAKQYLQFSESPVITRQRHRALLANAAEQLSLFDFSQPPELSAENLRLAIRHLEEITGAINTDDILDVLFSGFCIGK